MFASLRDWYIKLVPPKTDRKTDVQRPNIMPVLRWYVEHLSWMEDEL